MKYNKLFLLIGMFLIVLNMINAETLLIYDDFETAGNGAVIGGTYTSYGCIETTLITYNSSTRALNLTSVDCLKDAFTITGDLTGWSFIYYFSGTAIGNDPYIRLTNGATPVVGIEGNNTPGDGLELYPGFSPWLKINNTNAIGNWKQFNLLYDQTNNNCTIKVGDETSFVTSYFSDCTNNDLTINNFIMGLQTDKRTIIDNLKICDGPCDYVLTSTSTSNFTITALNLYNNTLLQNFNATINGTIYTTNTGSINTYILQNNTIPFNITLQTNNMFNITYIDYNVSNDLQANMSQYPVIFMTNKWNNSNLSNITINISNIEYSTTNYKIYLPYNTTQNIISNISTYIPVNININLSPNTLNQINISQTIINLSIYDFDNGITFNNFKAYLSNILVCNTPESNCTIYPNNGTYTNLTIYSNNDSFFPTTTNITFNNLDINNRQINVDSNITVTFNLKNLFSSSMLTNFSIYLNNSLVCNSGTSENCIYQPKLGYYNVIAQKFGYNNLSTTSTFNHTQYQTFIYTISPIANFMFYDEKTGLPFNASSATSIILNILCPTQTISYDINTSINASNLFSTNLTCEFTQFKVDVAYGTTTYFRELFYPTYNIDFTNISVYLLNLNQVTAVGIDFVPDDTISQYSNIALIVNKYIGSNYVQITGGVVDLTGKITAYLLQNGIYTVDLYSDGVFVKQLGEYIANTGGTLSVRLYDIQFGSTISGFNNIKFQIYNDSTTYNGTNYLIGTYNDSGNGIQGVYFNVYQESTSGTLINSQYSTSQSAQFVFNSTPYSNMFLVCMLNITAYGINYPYIVQCQDITSVDFDMLEYVDVQIINWFLVILISVLALYSTSNTSDIINFVIIGLSAICNYFGWVVISSSFLAVAAVFTIIMYISNRHKEN